MNSDPFKIKNDGFFHEFMSHRVHEILLVASPYDAFILEEDGGLTAQIMTEYIGMDFNYAPRVTRASTAADAMSYLSKDKFDLVIVMLRIEDTDPISFGKSIKKLYPNKPVILLAFDETEIKQLSQNISPSSIDRVFIWSGDASVFPAIIKYVEDRKNAEKDITKGNVRAIILIEDSPRMYSILLPLIYKEIIYLTKNLMSKTLNSTHRSLHLRGRLKVLLTPNYETAEKFSKKYGDNIIGIISDVKFLNKGERDPHAGMKFAKSIRVNHPAMPIILQSTDISNQNLAKSIGADFLHKNSNTLLKDLRNFMVLNFGFGDFIFKDSNGKEIIKATNIEELIKAIETVPIESILYHGRNNHFSNWLAARSEFDLATKLRKVHVNKFDEKEDVRDTIIEHINSPNTKLRFGQVVDYSVNENFRFYRMCGGSLGGKARGLAFARDMLKQSGINNRVSNIIVKIPQTAIIGTDEFDRFMNDNKLWDDALKAKKDKKIISLFLDSRLSMDLILKLESFLKECHYPLAVRSSSLLEDSQYQPLSGAYSTFMLPNNQDTFKERIKQLKKAIKLVYASIFYQESKSYLSRTAHRTEEEKMAVLIMEIAGQKYSSGRFYPTFSGVLKSINYYPVSYMKRNEGVTYLALGFGKTIVDGGKCLGVSPKYPAIKPQFSTIKATLENSQSNFYSLELNENEYDINNDLQLCNLSSAESDGSLRWVGGVVTSEDNILRNSLSYKGTRVVNFSPILEWKVIPLCDILNQLLALGKKALGCPVEIEYAVNIFEDRDKTSEFHLLQIKPMVLTTIKTIAFQEKKRNEIFSQSQVTLGNGTSDNIRNLLYLRPNKYDPSQSKKIAKEIESFNNSIDSKDAYILAGPGRWGSADPWLGVPINWQQISNAKIIIEIGHKNFPVDPSFGSHFFQNLTSFHIGYFTIDIKNKNDFVNDSWLDRFEIKERGHYVEWYQFEKPFKTIINGLSGNGKIFIPEPDEVIKMDEGESTGI